MQTKSKSRTIIAAAGLCAGAALIAGQAAADPTPMAVPAIAPPLSANPNPFSVDGGPLGKVYITGVVSGMATATDHDPARLSVSGVNSVEPANLFDLSNAQVIIQNTSGPVQFYVQAGEYSQPFLGVPYFKASDATKLNFGNVPIAYIKLQPTAEISIQAGKLFPLIGNETTFTFQNTNIFRGLLVVQEPALSRGVQANYAKGKLSASVSLNDGFYSDKLNWVTGLVSYAATASDAFIFSGGGAVSKSSVSLFTTPPAQNNGYLFNLIWSHTQGPFWISPYFQYTHTPKAPELGLGLDHEASTWGAAVLTKYSLTPEWSLAGRVEYLKSDVSGCTAADIGTGNICAAGLTGFGPKAAAWSLTVTPTWQKGVFFARGELSYTHLNDTTAGLGSDGTNTSETRGVIEAGVMF